MYVSGVGQKDPFYYYISVSSERWHIFLYLTSRQEMPFAIPVGLLACLGHIVQ